MLICLFGGVIGIFFVVVIIIVFNIFGSDFKMVFLFEFVIFVVFCFILIGVVFGYMLVKNVLKLNLIIVLF